MHKLSGAAGGSGVTLASAIFPWRSRAVIPPAEETPSPKSRRWPEWTTQELESFSLA
jgi:hypothetical protein